MDPKLAQWLASWDTGTSSKAIALWMSGGMATGETPRDPSDLGRCLRLLELFPEWKARMPEMAATGGLWPTFSTRWDEIVASFMDECGGKIPGRDERFSCPKTYELMCSVHNEAYANDKPNFTETRYTSGPLAGCSVRVGK